MSNTFNIQSDEHTQDPGLGFEAEEDTYRLAKEVCGIAGSKDFPQLLARMKEVVSKEDERYILGLKIDDPPISMNKLRMLIEQH